MAGQLFTYLSRSEISHLKKQIRHSKADEGKAIFQNYMVFYYTLEEEDKEMYEIENPDNPTSEFKKDVTLDIKLSQKILEEDILCYDWVSEKLCVLIKR